MKDQWLEFEIRCYRRSLCTRWQQKAQT